MKFKNGDKIYCTNANYRMSYLREQNLPLYFTLYFNQDDAEYFSLQFFNPKYNCMDSFGIHKEDLLAGDWKHYGLNVTRKTIHAKLP